EDVEGYDIRRLAESVARYAEELQRRSGATVTVFDVGGGKRPSQLDDEVRSGSIECILSDVSQRLSGVRALFLEPGQALATPCEAVLAVVLEVRRSQGTVSEIVVDAGFPELPQIKTFPHRFFLLGNGKPRLLGEGRGRILGRTCLEQDVLHDAAGLDDCREGDAIAIADAGAYDASMAFRFARGRRAE